MYILLGVCYVYSTLWETTKIMFYQDNCNRRPRGKLLRQLGKGKYISRGNFHEASLIVNQLILSQWKELEFRKNENPFTLNYELHTSLVGSIYKIFTKLQSRNQKMKKKKKKKFWS